MSCEAKLRAGYWHTSWAMSRRLLEHKHKHTSTSRLLEDKPLTPEQLYLPWYNMVYYVSSFEQQAIVRQATHTRAAYGFCLDQCSTQFMSLLNSLANILITAHEKLLTLSVYIHQVQFSRQASENSAESHEKL